MITSKQDANRLINACVSAHRNAWDSALDSEDYVIRMRAPMDPEKLQEKAIWAHNYNYGKGRNELKRAVKQNVQEIAKSISLLEVNFVKFNKKKHNTKLLNFIQVPELRQAVEERIAYTLGEFIEQDQSFNLFISKAEYMTFMFGYAPVCGDSASYVPNVVHFCDIGFDDHTPLNDVQKFVLFETKKASYYFDKLRSIVKNDIPSDVLLDECDDSYITKDGWNKEELITLVCNVFNDQDGLPLSELRIAKGITDQNVKVKYENWEDIALINDRMGYSWCLANLNNIQIARCFEISRQCVNEVVVHLSSTDNRGNRSEYTSNKGILQYKKHPKAFQDDLINLVYDFSVDGSTYIHDVSGASRVLAEHSQRYDLKVNAREDSQYLASLIWFSSNSGAAITRIGDGISIGGGIAVMSDVGFEPIEFKQRIDNSDLSVSVIQEQQVFDETFSNWKPNTRLSNRPTKDEVQFINAEAYAQRSGDVPFKLKAYSKIITNAFRKLASGKFMSYNLEAQQQKFIAMLEQEFSDEGLTKEEIYKILAEVDCVKISPVLSDREAIAQAMSFAGTSQSRKWLTKMLLLSYGFSPMQVRSMIELEEYGTDASIAALENVAFETTAEVAFGIGQDHMLHLNAHFYRFDRKIKGVQEGEDPVVAFNTLRNGLQNTAKHIQAMATNVFYRNNIKDYQKWQKMFENDLKELGQMLDQMKNQAQQEGGAGNQQISPELRQKLMENDIKLREKLRTQQIRTEQAQKQRIEQQQFNQKLQQQKADFDSKLKAQKTQSEIESTLAKTAAEMAK